MKITGFVEEPGGTVLRFSLPVSPGIYQYHNENIPVIEMKCDPFPESPFPAKNNQKLTESL